MLKITDLTITPESIGSKYLLVDVRPKYVYVNGEKTDKIAGYGYTIALPEKRFETLTVKIDGAQLMEKPGDDYIEVRFDNLEIFIYWLKGLYNVGARATGIHPVSSKA